MLASLEEAGYQYPTQIQAGLIPLALEGVDVVGQARTGTGKTASFAIPILEQMYVGPDARHPQALVLVPTRELAVQVRDEFAKLSFGRPITSVAVYGGKPIRSQIDKLKAGVHVVVGTPGRVLDHLARGTIQMDELEIVVLDEADRMLDIGFRPDIEKILRRCPKDRQTLLLSATVPPPIAKLAERYMVEPTTLNFSPKELAVETIEQFYYTVDPQRKFDLLQRLIEREKPRQAIVFCRTKRGTEKIFQRLSKKLPGVGCMHGDMNQGGRDRVMRGFRDGTISYLIATDVVGRGIDVSAVSHIINFDIPAFSDDYVHRVGRTGRMGREGVAYTFVAPDEGPELTRIEQRINIQLKRGEMENFEMVSAPMPLNRAIDSETGEAIDVPAPPPLPTNLMRRPPKRYRRGV
ncbi:DEAD-box ATP-dependent RNA helicase CshA [Anatilimnocola aggregata]|uniref:DEAD-box ATP-dependent RNA helicase CshA n=2 Tax=Anatilimnocola aggregata TaxID=2528021 RepID=A0A517YJZ4_9BACT|nr:DEAD-box ATP-dependent RNA helicase CshA [Anatilimnocola aggregata]